MIQELITAAVPVLISLCGSTAPPPEYKEFNAPPIVGIEPSVKAAVEGDLIKIIADCKSGRHLTTWFAIDKEKKELKLVGVSEQTEAEKAAAKLLQKEWLQQRSMQF